MADVTINPAPQGSPTPTDTSSEQGKWATIPEPKNRKEWMESDFVRNDEAGTLKIYEFHNTTECNDPRLAYWRDLHINWTLELARQKHTHLQDVLIAKTWYSQACLKTFYSCRPYEPGVELTDRTQEERFKQGLGTAQEEWAVELKELSRKKIIILPVNNDMFKYEREAASTEAITNKETSAATEDNEAQLPQPKNNQEDAYIRYAKANGSHWSFIVIDRRSDPPTASYIDPMVRAVRHGNKYRTSNTEFNAPIAGKILCGFDLLLGLERGAFKTGTLKWTPHMVDDNAVRYYDAGPCGPWIYSFLDYLLSNRNFIDEGLAESFTQSKKRTHKNALKFDSIQARKRFKDELWEERIREESSEKRLARLNLTYDVLKDLITQPLLDVLINGLPTSRRRPGNGSVSGGGPPKPPGPGRPRSASDGDLTDFSDPNKTVAWARETYPGFFEGKSDDQVLDWVLNFYTNQHNGPTSGDESGSQENVNVPREPIPEYFIDLSSEKLDLWRKSHENMNPKIPHAHENAALAGHLQQMYGTRFENMSDDGLRNWRQKDGHLFFGSMKAVDVKSVQQELLRRRNYGETPRSTDKTFIPRTPRAPSTGGQTSSGTRGRDESDNPADGPSSRPELSNTTSVPPNQDPAMTDFAHLSAGGIELWLSHNPDLQQKLDAFKGDKGYTRYVECALLHAKHKGTFQGQSDADLNHVWREDEHVFPFEQRNEKIDPSEIARRMDAHYLPNASHNNKRPRDDGDSSGEGPNKRPKPSGIPEGADPKATNFALLTREQRKPWENAVNAKLWENHPNQSYSVVLNALLHKTYKGTFMNESARDCKAWQGNPDVFNEKERRRRQFLSTDEVRQRMEAFYNPTSGEGDTAGDAVDLSAGDG